MESSLQAETNRELEHQLLRGRHLAGVAQLVLLAFLSLLLVDDVHPLLLAAWAVSILLALAFRDRCYRHTEPRSRETNARLRWVRLSVGLLAVSWGLGAQVIAGMVPSETFAPVLVVLTGLLAAGATSLVADPPSFRLFSVGLIGPLVIGLLTGPMDRDRAALVGLVLFFAVGLRQIQARTHRSLVESIRTRALLVHSRDAADRGRAYLDALVASAPIAIAVLGAERRVTRVNPAFTSLFGYTDAEANGNDLDTLIVPDAGLPGARELHARVDRGEAIAEEVERRRKDGSAVPVLVSAARVRAVDGGTFLLYQDISTPKAAAAALRDSEERYRHLVESASDLVWEIDADGRWLFLNAAAERVYGRSLDALLGRPVAETTDSHCQALDREAFSHLLAGSEMLNHETIHLDAQGSPRRLSFAGRPVLDPHGRVVGARGTARDVTEQIAAREAISRAAEAAEAATALKSRFLANMSHEIRTPMNGILGMTELLLDEPLSAEQRRSLTIVQTSARNLLDVLNEILDFSKLEAGRLDLESIPFDLRSVAESVVRLLAAQAGTRAVELVADISPDIPPLVRGDPTRLRQVLTNLIGNAVKFTHAGEVVLSVRPAEPDPATIEFSVRDTGIGIPADKLVSIFQAFTQGDASTTRSYGGTGLGLAIVERIVRMMGGAIEVESELGRGSRFSFQVSLPPDVAAAGGVAAPASRRRLFGMRALVVDDSGSHRRVVHDMLRWARMRVDEAVDAEDGLGRCRQAAARGQPYDLVVLDAHMPGRDGFELAACLRSEPVLAASRLLMLTSAGQRGDAARCRELGVSAYLSKPIARTDLLEAAETVLREGADAPARPLVTRHSIQEGRRKLRILLAEDNAVNQEVVVKLLRRRGHHVEVVEDGRAAVSRVAAGKFDLVLMDAQMPIMDGVDATREIRLDPRFAALPIIALTAYAAAGERERLLAAGMTAFLGKPFLPMELFAVVEGLGGPEGEPSTPAGAPVVAAGPVDLEGLRRRLRDADAEDAVDDLLDVFRRTAPASFTQVERAIEAGEPAAIARAAHAFRSASGAIGALGLASLLHTIERTALGSDPTEPGFLLRQIRAEYERVMGALLPATESI